jgi:hypothetical protein
MDFNMSTLSQFTGTSKPLKVTTYTSGSGTFTPEYTGWCRITLVGGGGGGGGSVWIPASGGGGFPTQGGGPGGAAGAISFYWAEISGPIAYSVGTGGEGGPATGGAPPNGQSGTNGGNTTFGSFTAHGGGGGSNGAEGFYGTPGQSCLYGAGGQTVTVEQTVAPYTNNPVMNGKGYGAGGAGGHGASQGAYTKAGDGAGGLIIIEEYGP